MSHVGLLLSGIALVLANGLYVVAASAAGTIYGPAQTPLTWGMLLGLLVGGCGLLVGRSDSGRGARPSAGGSDDPRAERERRGDAEPGERT